MKVLIMIGYPGILIAGHLKADMMPQLEHFSFLTRIFYAPFCDCYFFRDVAPPSLSTLDAFFAISFDLFGAMILMGEFIAIYRRFVVKTVTFKTSIGDIVAVNLLGGWFIGAGERAGAACRALRGLDERLIEQQGVEEVSIGDYVLSGGELAGMVLMDSVVRQLPGALGDAESASQDSFVQGLLNCPHYTRPESYRGATVPAVLLSSNHAAIARWRLKQSLGRTWQRRPELLERRVLSTEERELLDEYRRELQGGCS